MSSYRLDVFKGESDKFMDLSKSKKFYIKINYEHCVIPGLLIDVHPFT
jgi:hypothetical protein